MSKALEFSGRVTNGRLPQQVSERIAATIRQAEGKYVVVTVRVQARARSLNQNNFYHGPFIEAIRQNLLDHGYRLSHDDIHSGLRDAYAKNGYTIPLPDGGVFLVPPSTARLEKPAFEDFLEEIRADYARRFGWQLPFPNEH